MEQNVIHVNQFIVKNVEQVMEFVNHVCMDITCIKINVIHVQQWIIVLIVIMVTDIKNVLKDVS